MSSGSAVWLWLILSKSRSGAINVGTSQQESVADEFESACTTEVGTWPLV